MSIVIYKSKHSNDTISVLSVNKVHKNKKTQEGCNIKEDFCKVFTFNGSYFVVFYSNLM